MTWLVSSNQRTHTPVWIIFFQLVLGIPLALRCLFYSSGVFLYLLPHIPFLCRVLVIFFFESTIPNSDKSFTSVLAVLGSPLSLVFILGVHWKLTTHLGFWNCSMLEAAQKTLLLLYFLATTMFRKVSEAEMIMKSVFVLFSTGQKGSVITFCFYLFDAASHLSWNCRWPHNGFSWQLLTV